MVSSGNGPPEPSRSCVLARGGRELAHLSRRFIGSLRVVAPAPEEERGLLDILTPAEAELYRAQPLADRAHSVDCARSIAADRSVAPSRDLIAASALHDVAKAEAGLGTFGRVGATVVGVIAGRSRTAGWLESDHVLGRVARYRHHDDRGAELLRAVGSAELVVTWAREHHWSVEQCSIDPELAAALRRADG